MKIGIIVYSQTGNTMSVAQKIKTHIEKKGAEAIIEQIEVEGNEQPRKNPFTIKIKPDVGKYDGIIFGSLVEAFSLSPVMKEYLNQLSTLENTKVSLFVTQHLPYPWMGGNRAIKTMKKICKSKGAIVEESAVVNWSSKKRVEMIDNAIKKISNTIL